MELQKILLVDDDKSCIHLNRTMLKYSEVKCQIDECHNGHEALIYIAHTEKLPDVILLDINMPVLDGFGFLEKFDKQVELNEQAKVFVLSSSRTEVEMIRSLQYPCVKGCFEKPLSETHIQDILSAFMTESHIPQ